MMNILSSKMISSQSTKSLLFQHRRFVNTTALGHKYITKTIGSGFEARTFIYDSDADTSTPNTAISPWHDVPILNNLLGNFNYVNEIPKGTRAKMEAATKEERNPIKQDEKDNKPRFFTYGNLPFNYGFIPQTYEDPTEQHHELKLFGDNDPVDVIELSTGALAQGQVVPLKVIGVLALIDEGEVDWKIIGVNSQSPLARLLDKPDDIDAVLPGMENAIREWFRMYKTTDGKPMNTFGYDERILSRDFALQVIDETHNAWKKLVNGEIPANGLYVIPAKKQSDN